jgi:hypothetical protein
MVDDLLEVSDYGIASSQIRSKMTDRKMVDLLRLPTRRFYTPCRSIIK